MHPGATELQPLWQHLSVPWHACSITCALCFFIIRPAWSCPAHLQQGGPPGSMFNSHGHGHGGGRLDRQQAAQQRQRKRQEANQERGSGGLASCDAPLVAALLHVTSRRGARLPADPCELCTCCRPAPGRRAARYIRCRVAGGSQDWQAATAAAVCCEPTADAGAGRRGEGGSAAAGRSTATSTAATGAAADNTSCPASRTPEGGS